jgi:hypothetical protein
MAAPHRTQTELFSESHAGLSSHPPSAIVSAKPNPIILSIKPSYLEALQALGYCESEARFLYIVATHSGYFVARQFLAFTCAIGASARLPSGTSCTRRNTHAPNTSQ